MTRRSWLAVAAVLIVGGAVGVLLWKLRAHEARDVAPPKAVTSSGSTVQPPTATQIKPGLRKDHDMPPSGRVVADVEPTVDQLLVLAHDNLKDAASACVPKDPIDAGRMLRVHYTIEFFEGKAHATGLEADDLDIGNEDYRFCILHKMREARWAVEVEEVTPMEVRDAFKLGDLQRPK